MIKLPPYKDEDNTLVFVNTLGKVFKEDVKKVGEYLAFQRVVDDKGRYLHFDKFRYLVPSDINAEWAWVMMKHARNQQLLPLLELGRPKQLCKYLLTPSIQQALSWVDRHTSAAALDIMSSKIGGKKQLIAYLINDLIENEAISSSQLEGAATTTIVAKEIVKHQRKPKTPDEKMILGNFKMMRLAWEKKDENLSIDLISKMHAIGTEGIEDNKYTPGVFRKTDDVIIIGNNDEVLYQPPSADGLRERLKSIADWINTKHDISETNNYIHSLIKAIVLHFAIGYEHPFRDGNGRVARGLFYWFLFKCDYTAFRYISISTLLKKAPAKYAKSYLYSESDQMDLTYFIDYQSRIILRAINNFIDTYQTIRKDIEDFDRWLWNSGLYGKLSDKQRVIFSLAKDDEKRSFSINEVKDNLNCSYNTAANALNGLIDLKLFGKRKDGREWKYYMVNKHDIRQNWLK